MLCVGVDFGSTYTTVSVYSEETGKLEAQTLSEGGTPFIPSVVSLSKGQISVGREAKMMSMMGRKGVQSFRAFKMMLAEENEEVLADRGFTAAYTPEHVAADFLENVLKQVLDNIGEKKIDHLVVGVPEIWNSTLSTIDGRSRLRDICRSFPFVEKNGVQVVSEPAAASAFFAYNFRQMVGNNFDGKILLIDYGGGTLDITLNEVEVRSDQNGQEGMEIRILYRTGAGENEQRQIGKASIVYMESLLEAAIRQALPEITIEHDVHFYRALDGLESQLQECTNIIKNIFDDYGTDPKDLSEDDMDEVDYIFTMIPYKGMFINVSYQLMVEVYNQIIRGVFDEKLYRYQNTIQVQRLLDEIEGSSLYTFDSCINIPMARNHYDRCIHSHFHKLSKNLHSIHFRHLDITKDNAVLLLIHHCTSLHTVFCNINIISLIAKNLFQ